jgi:hypothetical protein
MPSWRWTEALVAARIHLPARLQRGAFLLLAVLLVVTAIAALLAGAGFRQGDARARVTERALAAAREALIAYAAGRPISAAVGPGYLPCPDLDGDGWAESTCGSLDGASGQAQRLGRLPWKTLGLPMLTDGDGERLWYAVSTKYKGLLNCSASRACVDMSPPAALGTITVRDASGHRVHDGTLGAPERAAEGGAGAGVIAPGAILERLRADGTRGAQHRDCAAGDCDAEGTCTARPPQLAATCDPLNYLDRAPPEASGEDNAAFVDRADAAGRASNGDGFIAGPLAGRDGGIVVNDRLVAIGYAEVMPAILRRVALEVAHCLRGYATRPENAARYPWPAAACAPASGAGGAPDVAGTSLGTIADTPFTRTSLSSNGRMLERWWRHEPRDPEALSELPTSQDACRIAVPPADAGAQRTSMPGTPLAEGESAPFVGNAWWSTWRPFVAYALARGFAPDAPGSPSCAAGACLTVADGTGRTLASDKEIAVIASTSCASAPRCDASGCARIVLDDDPARHGLASFP